MEINYNEVPNIITGKDLDYLSDMFNWHYGAYKSTLNASNSVEDPELKQLLEKGITKDIKGFKSKSGKEFKAKLQIKEGEVKFVF